jgi:hypothetical protein
MTTTTWHGGVLFVAWLVEWNTKEEVGFSFTKLLEKHHGGRLSYSASLETGYYPYLSGSGSGTGGSCPF